MRRKGIDTICAALPGARPSDPAAGELDAWKVGGKMFACFGHPDTGPDDPIGVSVKTPSVDDARMLIDLGRAVRAAYFHASWVQLPPELDIPADEMADRIANSYRVVRAGLTKKAQAALPTLDAPD